jgi:hypothetical protein
MNLSNSAINRKLARLADDTVIQNARGRSPYSGIGNMHSEVVSDSHMGGFMADDEIIDDLGLTAEMADEEDMSMAEMHDAGMAQFGRGAEMYAMDDMADEEDMIMAEMHDAGMAQFGRGAEMYAMDDMADEEDMIMAEMHDAGMAQFGRGAEMYDADDEGMDLATALAEQVEALKMANTRLARQVRKLADDAVAKGTGYSDSEEELMEDSVEQPKGLERLASALADFFAEDEIVEADEDEGMLASILAEVESAMDKKAKAKKSEEEAEDEQAEDEQAEEEEAPKASSKKASPRPRKSTRSASVKTLGTINREASSSDDLSKLWETAPDVSKYFG